MRPYGTTLTQAFKGLMRAVGVYAKPLTPLDVRALHGAMLAGTPVGRLSQVPRLFAQPHNLFPVLPQQVLAMGGGGAGT